MFSYLIDTNILFQLLKNDLNFEDFLEYRFIIPDFIWKEFEFKVKEEYNLKNLDKFKESLIRKGFIFLNTNYILNKNADDLLLKLAEERNYGIVTIDKKLKKRAIGKSIKIKWVEKGKKLNKNDISEYY